MAMKFFRKLTAIAATAAVIAVCWNPLYTAARAEEPEPGIRMNTIFSDHMVLQRDKKVEIYGEAAAGASVKVTFKGQEKPVRRKRTEIFPYISTKWRQMHRARCLR